MIEDVKKFFEKMKKLSLPDLELRYASHRLFCDAEYSISDAIRINDFCNEVEVISQNYGEHQIT